MLEAVLQFAGRLHPMVLHAPIGIAIGLLALEILGLIRGKQPPREVRWGLAWLMAGAAVVSAGSGLLLSRESAYDAETVFLHQWLGIGVAAAAVLAAAAQQAGRVRVYGLMLVVTCGVLVPAGHLGASITHGEGFLTAPFTKQRERPAAPKSGPGPGSGEVMAAVDSASVYARVVAPIFDNRCVQCHSPKKHKGKLLLDTPEGIAAGGESGPALVAGDAEASEIIRRLRLPIDDEEHMPPKSKGQPTGEEIAALEAWIKAGASFIDPAPGDAGPAVHAGVSKPEAAPGPAGPVAADPKALDAIRAKLVHVEPVSRGSELLIVDASAVAKEIGDGQVAELLGPVREQVADLTLARTGISDAGLKTIAAMPNLRRLNLSASGVGDPGIAALAGHPKLEELVLTQTKTTDASVEVIAALPALRRVFVWKTGLTAEGIASLRGRRAELVVDAGDAAQAVALDKEEQIKLTGDAPVPGAAVAAAGAGTQAAAELLKPVNTVCPVSGKAVDTNFAIVYKGRVIGFCCKICLGQFLDDPAKFEGKVEPKAP